MIVSHEHRFIFLKVRKTAGTSIEVALSRIAGDDAIVTPILEDEPSHQPRNYAALEQGEGPLATELRRLLRQATPDAALARSVPYYNHMPARLLRVKLGEEIWESYFKFCFERNPWDKVASMYGWSSRGLASPPPFEDWVFSSSRVFSDWPIYTLDEACAVDAVGRYETLTEDFAALLRRIGLSSDGFELPKLKSGFRREVRYSPECAEHVGRIYRREIEMLNYECPLRLQAG
jgi:Sulfotransferase family